MYISQAFIYLQQSFNCIVFIVMQQILAVVLTTLEITSSLTFSSVCLVAQKLQLCLLDGWFLLVFYYFAPTWNKDNNNNNNKLSNSSLNHRLRAQTFLSGIIMFLRAYCFVNVLTLSTHIIQPGLTLVWYSSILLMKSICEFILSAVYCYSERPPLSKIFYYMTGLFLQGNTAALHRSVARDFSEVSQLRLLLLFPFFWQNIRKQCYGLPQELFVA